MVIKCRCVFLFECTQFFQYTHFRFYAEYLNELNWIELNSIEYHFLFYSRVVVPYAIIVFDFVLFECLVARIHTQNRDIS